ncbi:MAG: SRPBCC family protein [Jiangellaceae bacterium]
MRFETTTSIAATPQQVWEVYADVERWPEWTASVTSVERLDPGPLRVGARTRIKQPKLPVAVWEVTELVDGERWVWVATGPGVTTTAAHEIRASDSGATATATIDQNGPVGALIGRLTRGLTERYLALEGAGLKARSEGQR